MHSIFSIHSDTLEAVLMHLFNAQKYFLDRGKFKYTFKADANLILKHLTSKHCQLKAVLVSDKLSVNAG